MSRYWFLDDNEYISMDFHQTGLVLLMGKFRKFFPACHMLILSFPDDILSKCHWNCTKLSVCIDIWRSGLGLLIVKFCQFSTGLSAYHVSVFLYPDINSLNLVFTLILWRSSLGLVMGRFRQFLTEVSSHHMIVMGYYYFTFLFQQKLLVFFLFIHKICAVGTH